MPFLVVTGAVIQCAGALPPGIATFTATAGTVKGGKMDAGTKSHQTPTNIPTFGMCNLTTNPTVASATSAAMGVHTPMPCQPNIASPWTPGATKVKISNDNALHDGCTASCSYGGAITVKSAGQTVVQVK